MGIFARAMRASTLTSYSNDFLDAIGARKSSTGLSVTGDDALTVSHVYAATRMIAEDIASLPFPVYRGFGDARSPDRSHPLWRTLNREANSEMSAISLRETITGHAVLRGTGYAEIETRRDRINLWPLDPTKVRVVRNGTGNLDLAGIPKGELVHLYRAPGGVEVPLEKGRVFRLPGFGPDGLVGYSILRLAMEGIAVSLAAERFAARYFANDAKPGIVLTTDAMLSDDEVAQIEAVWDSGHRGLDNAHRYAILEGGLGIEQIGINVEDAQLLETRTFQIREFARYTRIPVHKLGDMEHATFTNIEHQSIEYVVDTLRPWAVRWDQRVDIDLLPSGDHHAEHNLEGRLQGDTAARATFHQALKNASATTSNNIARKENLPTSEHPAADAIWYPLNMVPDYALDANGMTMRDRVNNTGTLVRAGFDPTAALAAMGLPTIAHTGLVPITVTVDPEKLQEPAR